jgi:hypothetical protein
MVKYVIIACEWAPKMTLNIVLWQIMTLWNKKKMIGGEGRKK